MKLSHDLKNINIHLVNFFQFFLTSFFNYPAAILGWNWHGPHFKTKSHRCPKIGTCVPYSILKWAIRLLFLVLQNKYFFANFYVCLISIFGQNMKHFPKTDQYTLTRISWRWCMRSFKRFFEEITKRGSWEDNKWRSIHVLEKTVIKVMGSGQHIIILQNCSVDTEVYSIQVMCEKFQVILLRNK